MKVLFVSNLITDYSGYEPLGILFLAGALKKAGHHCRYSHVLWEDIASEMEHFKPEIIAFSCTTGTHREYLDLNREIKEKYDVVSVFGGPHATFFPELTPSASARGRKPWLNSATGSTGARRYWM
jgi:radical SAM superfamily enzyme YgiQ (UPF0313 family)